MSVVFETFNTDGRVQYSASQPPYVYLGKVTVGANAGSKLNSAAYIQDTSAPNFSPEIERVIGVQIPEGTRFVAVTGTKYPNAIGFVPYNGPLSRFFNGVRAGISTFYCFGMYNATPVTSGPVFDLFDPNGKLLFDLRARPMKVMGQGSTAQTDVPGGRTYAAIATNYGVASQVTGVTSRRYIRTNLAGPGTSGAQVGMYYIPGEITKDNSGSDEPGSYPGRNPSYTVVDVTGL